MTQIRISRAAALLGVSDDTVRRWIDQGRLSAAKDSAGVKVVDGADLARLASDTAESAAASADALDDRAGTRSARNRFTGLVVALRRGDVLSQVELQAGPFHVVSVITTDAVDQLGLDVGSVASALVKSTDVQIEKALL